MIRDGKKLSVHKDDKAIIMIEKLGRLRRENDYYCPDTQNSPEDLIRVFGNYHFPLATWFCYSPVDGEPCGRCNPCKYTIQEGIAPCVAIAMTSFLSLLNARRS